MRCRACDTLLTDHESTHKDEHGNFLDMCWNCQEDGTESLPEYQKNPDETSEFPENEDDEVGLS